MAINAATIATFVIGCSMADGYPAELADAIRASSERLGISPHDLATAISYESGFKPGVWGGQGGQHLGLIQFSPENQKKYGVTDKQSAPEQMGAVEAYLRDRGVKPGMGLLDTYSAINAGRPGLYSRSDTANGGAPGTVADKVANQMYGHRLRANAMLGGQAMPSPMPSPRTTASVPDVGGSPPFALAPAPGPDASPDATAGILAALQSITQMANQPAERMAMMDPIKINFPVPQAVARARAMARAAARGA